MGKIALETNRYTSQNWQESGTNNKLNHEEMFRFLSVSMLMARNAGN